MADVILLTDTTTSQTLTASGDQYYLAAGATHYSTGGDTLNITTAINDIDISVFGTLLYLGTSGAAINTIGSGSEGLSIAVAEGGAVLATGNWRAILLGTENTVINNHGLIQGGEAIRSQSVNTQIYNYGTIAESNGSSSTSLYAITFEESDAKLFNVGTVAGENGVRAEGSSQIVNSGEIVAVGNAIYNVGSNATESMTLINSGTITGGSRAYLGSFDASDFVTNSGTIHGEVSLMGASDSLSNSGAIHGAVLFGSGFNTLNNSGTIMGDVTLAGATTVTNSGLISGFVSSPSGGGHFFYNEGTITGGVQLSSGSDFYRGGGQIAGDLLLGNSADTAIMGEFADKVYGGIGTDTLRTAGGNDLVDGGNDGDSLYAGAGDDSVYGGLGDDDVWAGDGDDLVLGGADNDVLRGGRGDDDVRGDDGNDNIFGGAGHDVLEGNGGNDIIRASDGDDEVIGGSGNDVLRGDKGEDVLVGSSGSDNLFGGHGDDELYGGNGSDDLNGGRGDDTLEGGSGGDVFIFTSQNGHDVVLDFVSGEDQLDLSSFDVATLSEVKAAGVDTEMGWLMDLSLVGGSGTILLVGVLEADLLGSDVIF